MRLTGKLVFTGCLTAVVLGLDLFLPSQPQRHTVDLLEDDNLVEVVETTSGLGLFSKRIVEKNGFYIGSFDDNFFNKEESFKYSDSVRITKNLAGDYFGFRVD